MDIQSAYKEAGTLRGAAAICGTTHKTVKRILEAAERAEAGVAVKQERNFDGVRGVVAEKINTCQARLTDRGGVPHLRLFAHQRSTDISRRAEDTREPRQTDSRLGNWVLSHRDRAHGPARWI